ncbi:MAG TPA: hypothetical protein ENK14_12355 [Caldithrix sp.]|nr:hypothetical protein [Caldithrix sp.]
MTAYFKFRHKFFRFFLALFALLLLFTVFSSTLPDGLEWIAQQVGISEPGNSLQPAPFSDYVVSSQLPRGINQVLSGLLGFVLLVGIVYLLYFVRKRKMLKNRHTP